MSKKLVLVVASLLILLTIGGCWSRREVESLAIVMILALDKVKVQGEEKYRWTLRVVRPGQLAKGAEGGGGGGGGKPVSWVASTLGETPFDAGRNFATRSPRRAFLAHSQIIIIGEKVAKEGVHEILDILLRHKDIRLRNWVIIAKGEAANLITAEPELETLLAEQMSQLIDVSGPMVSKGTALDLKDFAQALLNPGLDPVTGWMEAIRPPEKRTIAEAGPEVKPVPKAVRYHGGAVFRKDKLVGFLGDRHTMGYLFIKGEAKGGIIPIRESGQKEKDVSFSMVRATSEIKPVIKKGKITFDIKIKSEGDLGEYEETRGIAKQEKIQQLEKDIQSVIKLYAQSALFQAQKKHKADIFGFGDILHRKEPKIWHQVEKDWYSIYPKIPVTVSVSAKIRRTGMLSEPVVIK